MNEIKIFGTTERTAGIKAMEAAGFPALRSGLGVSPGAYHFITPNDQNIYATKPIESAKGKFGLTLVAGMLKGAEEHNKDVNNSYGLTASDKQFVVTYDQWLAIEPNQKYDVVINDKGRINTLVLSESDDIVETSKVITKAKKAKAISI